MGLLDARTVKPLDTANETEAGQTPRYVLRGDLRAKTALVRDDGSRVVVIDDFSK